MGEGAAKIMQADIWTKELREEGRSVPAGRSGLNTASHR